MKNQSEVSWLDLPHELWLLIGQRLDTYIDVLRFRSVCRLWRHSLSNPPNLNPDKQYDGREVLRNMIYRFTPLGHHRSSNFVSSKGFLAMIDATNSLQPSINLNHKSNNEGKKVNFMDFRIQEVAQAYSITPTNTQIINFKRKIKISVLNKHKNPSTIMALHYKGNLMLTKYSETFKRRNSNKIEDASYDDTIVYKEQIYTIDIQGKVFLIDSSMNFVQVSPPMSVFSDFKHLVECEGNLYVVDRFLERDERESNHFDPYWLSTGRWCNDAKSVDFKVHRLDLKRRRWIEIKNLGNMAFFLGLNCFSISSPAHLLGFERNCIYFLPKLNSCFSYDYNVHVFNFEKKIILKSSARILRTPPI